MNTDRWVKDFIDQIQANDAMIGDRPDRRLDAGETAVLSNQLTDIISRPFDYKFPPKKARQYIPYRSTINPSARIGGYNQYQVMGKADYFRVGVNKINAVTAQGAQTTKTIEDIAVKAQFTIQELREAAFAGVPLDTMKMAACRKTIEDKLDSIATLGSSMHNHDGALNHTNMTAVSAATGSWTTATTVANIRKDIQKLWNVFDGTTLKGVHRPNALFLPQTQWQYLHQPMGSGSDTTLLMWLKENFEGLQIIDKWDVLNTAGSGSATRMVAAEINDINFWLEVPIEFEARPPSAESNLTYEVVCLARTGGVFAPFPLSLAYMDSV